MRINGFKLTEIEEPLYIALKKREKGFFRDYKVDAQVKIDRYRVDFLIRHKKISSVRLVIECDGHWHEKSPEQVIKDKERNRNIQSRGYRVINFSGREITRNICGVVMSIENHLRALIEYNKEAYRAINKYYIEKREEEKLISSFKVEKYFPKIPFMEREHLIFNKVEAERFFEGEVII